MPDRLDGIRLYAASSLERDPLVGCLKGVGRIVTDMSYLIGDCSKQSCGKRIFCKPQQNSPNPNTPQYRVNKEDKSLNASPPPLSKPTPGKSRRAPSHHAKTP